MELRQNIDEIMSNVSMGEEMHRAIMEGKPGKRQAGQRNGSSNRRTSQGMAGTAEMAWAAGTAGTAGTAGETRTARAAEAAGTARAAEAAGTAKAAEAARTARAAEAARMARAARTARSAEAARMARAARTARSAEAARTAKAAEAAGTARAARTAGTGENMERKRTRKPVWRKAAVPMAAAVLVMSTMYVTAGYLIDHTPLRDIFASRDDNALSVPEQQQRPDIYGEILDDSFSSVENQMETETNGGSTETDGSGAETNGHPRGKYGEIVVDNDQFSIELLETTCAGRELTFSYILTRKTDQLLTVHVNIDNDYPGQWQDGAAGEQYDSSKSLMKSGFGDSFQWNDLPEGCGYELAENQELRIFTQLGKKDYATGTYTLYVESRLRERTAEKETEGDSEGEPALQGFVEEDIPADFYRTSVEIVKSGDYGLTLDGSLDKTEEQVHFDQYEIYISPMTVYLTLDGTYQGEISSIWGAQRSHDITIGFADGTQTKATVLLNAMGYGDGRIDVDMRASFDTVIDPESIVKVMLDDMVLLGE